MSRRILRRVLFGCLGLTLVLGLVNAGWEYSKSLDRFSSEFQRLSQSFAPGLADALWGYQDSTISMMLRGIGENPMVGSVQVEDAQGKLLGQHARAGSHETAQAFWSLPAVSIELGREVAGSWQLLGRLVIVPDAGLLRAQIWSSIQASLLLAILFTLAIWLMVYRIVTRTVAVPLARLTREISAAGDSSAAAPLAYPYQDDIGVLVDALNVMRARLVAANLGLEAKVEERTRHLDEAMGMLRESKNRLNTILDSVEANIYIKDRDFRYSYANQQTCLAMGKSPSEIIGHEGSEFLPPEMAALLRDYDRRVIEHGERVEAEEVRRLADGRQVVYLTVKIPLRDESGRIYALCGISTDITERQLAQQALARHGAELERTVAVRTLELSAALQVAEQASRAKADFLANMSHEIRTPLNAVMGMTTLALNANPQPRVSDYLRKIQSSSRHLLGVINDILDFSKIEAQKLNLEQTEFELEAVLGQLTDVCAEKALGKGLEFVIDLAPDLPGALVGDPLRLGQVLINLVNNAVKFTEQGTVSVEVGLQQRRDHQAMLRFSVRDTGIGMTEQQRLGLFQSFQQADSSITRKFGGTGLGLAISKRLVELMGGAIEVESVPGQGSTFSFTALLGLGGGQERAAQARPVRQPNSPLGPLQALAGARVLLVEDNELNQEVATEFLQALGLQVELAPDGAVALELAQPGRHDVVLMDMQMPVMDGLTATRAIRQRPGFEHLPILAMTANAMAGDRQRCLDAGMNDHIAKPVDLQELADKLLRWVRPAAGRAASLAAGAVQPDANAAASAAVPNQPAQSADEQCCTAIEQVEGLDARLGLSQAAGRQPLYLSLLARFVADQSDAPQRLAQAIAAADWSEAERVAHTLKGVSAQIGALALRDCAASLEQAISQRQPAPEFEALQLQMTQLLTRLLQQITTALPQGEACTPKASIDPRQWHALRQRLARLLQESDTEALELFESNAALARQALGPRFEAVQQALSQFDFAAAQEIIEQA